ncbi:MAG: hypothetical protein H7339_14140 [Arcicella sp.]|nr:hypothetical protein [Arcicella sp.]
MKKLITICLIMAATFAANAQSPSKEETIEWIFSTLKNYERPLDQYVKDEQIDVKSKITDYFYNYSEIWVNKTVMSIKVKDVGYRSLCQYHFDKIRAITVQGNVITLRGSGVYTVRDDDGNIDNNNETTLFDNDRLSDFNSDGDSEIVTRMAKAIKNLIKINFPSNDKF